MIPLPDDNAPVAFATECDEVLLLRFRRECTAEEFFAVEGQIFHLWLGQSLSFLVGSDLVDSDLGARLSSLTDGYETLRRR